MMLPYKKPLIFQIPTQSQIQELRKGKASENEKQHYLNPALPIYSATSLTYSDNKKSRIQPKIQQPNLNLLEKEHML